LTTISPIIELLCQELEERLGVAEESATAATAAAQRAQRELVASQQRLSELEAEAAKGAQRSADLEAELLTLGEAMAVRTADLNAAKAAARDAVEELRREARESEEKLRAKARESEEMLRSKAREAEEKLLTELKEAATGAEKTTAALRAQLAAAEAQVPLASDFFFVFVDWKKIKRDACIACLDGEKYILIPMPAHHISLEVVSLPAWLAAQVEGFDARLSKNKAKSHQGFVAVNG
jgi:hypothetical protein